MVRRKLIASSPLVLVLLSVSAAAQSDPISDHSINPRGNHHRGDISRLHEKFDSDRSSGELLAETDAPANMHNEHIHFGGRRVALVPGSVADSSAMDVPVPCANLANPQDLYSIVEDDMVEDEREPFADLDAHFCSYSANSCAPLAVDDSPREAVEGQAKTQKAQAPAYQAPDKNNPKEIELNDVIFNETGGLRADPKAKPSGAGSSENLHDARVAVGEVAKRVLGSNHPEREQAPHTLTNETVRDLNAGNKDVIRSLNDSLSAARSGSDTTKGAMHFRTGRHKFRSLYGNRAILFFGPFPDATGGKRYITIAP